MIIFIAAMKCCLIILICLCSLFNKVCAQSPSAAIDSLIKYQIITVEDRPILEKELKGEKYSSYRVAILGGVESVMLQKKFHVDPHKTDFMISYGKEQLNKKNQDSVNTTLRILLEKIKKAGLLTDKVYTYTLKNIDSGSYVLDLQLIGIVREMSSRLEQLTSDKLLPVAEDLHKNGIVDDSSFVRLADDIRSDKIESAFQLNDYCKHSKAIDLAKYPDDPNAWLELIHRDIASILPGLNFTNFSYTEIPDTSFSLPGVRFKVSLVCNGHTYKHISLPFNNYRNKHEQIKPRDIFVEDFYRIFNKVLTDQQSPFRLHSIMFNPSNTGNDSFRYFALIALTGAQARVFMKESNYSYMAVSLDGYDTMLTSTKIAATIAGWKKIGLFTHLSEAEIGRAIDNTEASDPFSRNQLLSNFPQVIYSLDSAIMSPNCPYDAILNRLADITHGAFNPTAITQIKMNDDVQIRYFSNGITHTHTFNTANGWINAGFMKFIKRLSQENNLAGNFYQLAYEDSFIYLTNEQYISAKENKLLDF
ncbi:hypothetical protein HDF24_11100 [Mucilaginibacter sp. X4EP1]|uniref:hypothetical protein n=1 Tax=Mucilaginibacter sp. X4EP1 TaxID=2723092 RepID=UPI002167C150|nr:hypothetical protein [Mucilaginibacter sp. X4EP1]MCS3815550.1 hypothetical protein [Mucilaginibacter sp. X4EP1]